MISGKSLTFPKNSKQPTVFSLSGGCRRGGNDIPLQSVYGPDLYDRSVTIRFTGGAVSMTGGHRHSTFSGLLIQENTIGE